MKILLIKPNNLSDHIQPSLGLMLIASMLINAGHKVKIHDSALEGWNNKKLIDNFCNVIKQRKKTKVLYLSSGSVYGNYPKKVSEKNDLSPETNNTISDLNILGESKRRAESLVSIYSKKENFNMKIVRCFSFVGPLIPLDIHYAIGNFLGKSAMNQSITLNSNGKSKRSYMYMSDLAIWLWTILLKGKKNQIYNLGSDKAISILNLAKLINRLTGNKKKIKSQKLKNTYNNNYVPSILKAKRDLGLKIKVPLNKAILKTYKNINKNKFIYQELKKN